MPTTIAAPSLATPPVLLTPRQFLGATVGLLPLCALLILVLDQPLVRFCHFHLQGLEPFFSTVTAAADAAYHAAVKTRLLHLPVLFIGLGAAYAVGRWGLRRPWALAFLITLLVHLASVGTANVLKGAVRRLRPEVLLSTGYPDLGFNYAHAAHADSFPSTHTATYLSLLLPLALAFPRGWVPLLLLPVLIGLGRLVIGAHYPSDVLFSVWLVLLYTFLFGQLYRVPWLTAPAAARTL